MDRDHGDLPLVFMKKCFKIRQFLNAGCTIGPPEVDKDDFSSRIGQMEFSAIEGGRREIR